MQGSFVSMLNFSINQQAPMFIWMVYQRNSEQFFFPFSLRCGTSESRSKGQVKHCNQCVPLSKPWTAKHGGEKDRVNTCRAAIWIRPWLMSHGKYVSNPVHIAARQAPAMIVHVDSTFAQKQRSPFMEFQYSHYTAFRIIVAVSPKFKATPYCHTRNDK
jgi:hypothetical protein